MTGGRCRSWLPVLMLGYLLIYAVLLAETAYSLPRLRATCYPAFRTEAFRAGWLHRALIFAPVRWLVVVPCQRFPHLSAALLIAAVLLLSLGYLAALRAVRLDPQAWPLPRLLRVAALAALPLLLLLPPTSGDYLAYLFIGRVLSVYHLSPWHHVLAEFPAEQSYVIPTAWGSDLRCLYGPIWVGVMAAITGVSHLAAPGDLTFFGLVLNVLLLRAANLVPWIAAAIAVWRINGRQWPRQQRLVTVAFLLNPLLVYETLGALHNDLWGVAALLWACDLFLREDGRFVAPLVLSFLTKYAAAAMAPFIALYYWRRRDWRRLGGLMAAMLLGFGLVQWTAVGQLMTRLGAGRTTFFLSPTALPQFLSVMVVVARGLPMLSGSMVRTFANLLGGVFLCVYVALGRQTRSREQVVLHTLWALTIYFSCVHMDSMPWYYLWPLGLLFVTRWGPAALNVAWASTLVLLGYGAQFWNHSGLRGWDTWTVIPGFLTAIALPALVGLAGHRGWWRVCAAPVEAEPRPSRAATGPEPRPSGSGKRDPHIQWQD